MTRAQHDYLGSCKLRRQVLGSLVRLLQGKFKVPDLGHELLCILQHKQCLPGAFMQARKCMSVEAHHGNPNGLR